MTHPFKKLVLLILFFGKLSAQNKVAELNINLLANDKIADVNLDQDAFVKSLGLITDYCKKNFSEIPENQKIGILMIVHKSGKPSYECYSEPKIEKNLSDKILKDLASFQVDNTKILDFPLFISINTKSSDLSDFKDFTDPLTKQYEEFKTADLQKKYQLLKTFAITEALPVLSAYEVKVDDQFAGVKNFGKLVQRTNHTEPQSMEKLCNTNKDYWRANMEMNIGNQLIPITKVALLAAQGEFDYAQKFIEMIRMFSDPKSTAHYYLKEFAYRIELLNEDLQKQIEKGIAEHDKGNYQKAMVIYDEILKSHPNSAWARYEKYYSNNAMQTGKNTDGLNDRARWDVAKVEVYKHNPLYNLDVRANTGKEAYLIFRRQEINMLFKKKENKLIDVFKYAEIATDLGVYDFAAQLFWFCATFDKENAQNATNHYLYCLDKLGEKELKSNFKGDFDKIFKDIDKSRETEMKSNPTYQAMKNE